MNYEQFRQAFRNREYIKLEDILLYFPLIDRKQLTRWVQKGLLYHPVRSIYILPDVSVGRTWKMQFARELVSPSYISLEYALSYYGLIPEEAVVITSITTKKTQSYDLDKYGRYRYQSIVPKGFFGYLIRKSSDGSEYVIASPAKAVVDFLYLHRDYLSFDDFEAWRINPYEVQEQMKPSELRSIAKAYENKRLEEQIETFISFIW